MSVRKMPLSLVIPEAELCVFSAAHGCWVARMHLRLAYYLLKVVHLCPSPGLFLLIDQLPTRAFVAQMIKTQRQIL